MSQLMDEEHYNTLSLQKIMGKKPVHSFVFCGSTSFSGTPLSGKRTVYALIFSLKLRSFKPLSLKKHRCRMH